MHGLIGQHALLDDAVEHVAAYLWTSGLARITLRAKHLARALGLLAYARVDFVDRDDLAVGPGSIIRVVYEARTALHAKEHERRERQNQQY